MESHLHNHIYAFVLHLPGALRGISSYSSVLLGSIRKLHGLSLGFQMVLLDVMSMEFDKIPIEFDGILLDKSHESH